MAIGTKRKSHAEGERRTGWIIAKGIIKAVDPVFLSARTQFLQPSPTLAMTARARRMQADGVDVISFAAGEPDFNTPEPICEAAIRAIRRGMTKYTPSAGLPELRDAIAQMLTDRNAIPTTADQVVVSCGAKHSLYNAMLALVDPGDEAILIAPFWMTYSDQVRLAGGVPIVVQTSEANRFQPSEEQLIATITKRTKAIVLNSPCNPTGAVLEDDMLKTIARLAIKHDFWIITDQIYERLSYGPMPTSIASIGPEVAARTVTVGGCSKSFSMTGWRIGYSASPRPVAQAIVNIQDQVTSNATSFAQAGAIEAFRLPCSVVDGMRDTFRERRDLMFALMSEIPDLPVQLPDGAFYLFPDVGAYLSDRLPTDGALAEHLLDSANIATIPGSVFRGDRHVRFSYAASASDIRKGMARLAQTMHEIRK